MRPLKKDKSIVSMSESSGTILSKYPVTRTLMLITGAVPVVASVMSCKYLFLVRNDPFILEYKQYYRLLTFQFGAVTETDTTLLVLLWLQFRHLEGLMGARKYLSVVSLLYFYTTVIIGGSALLLNALVPWQVWNGYPTGCLPIMLALYHFYKEYTPQLYEFDVQLTKPWFFNDSDAVGEELMKWTLNDQFHIDVVVLLLIINQGWAGVVCGFVSWLTAIFIDKGLLPGLEIWRIPLFQYVGILFGVTVNSVDTADSEATDEDDAEPVRSLGTQFIDTFRR